MNKPASTSSKHPEPSDLNQDDAAMGDAAAGGASRGASGNASGNASGGTSGGASIADAFFQLEQFDPQTITTRVPLNVVEAQRSITSSRDRAEMQQRLSDLSLPTEALEQIYQGLKFSMAEYEVLIGLYRYIGSIHAYDKVANLPGGSDGAEILISERRLFELCGLKPTADRHLGEPHDRKRIQDGLDQLSKNARTLVYVRPGTEKSPRAKRKRYSFQGTLIDKYTLEQQEKVGTEWETMTEQTVYRLVLKPVLTSDIVHGYVKFNFELMHALRGAFKRQAPGILPQFLAWVHRQRRTPKEVTLDEICQEVGIDAATLAGTNGTTERKKILTLLETGEARGYWKLQHNGGRGGKQRLKLAIKTKFFPTLESTMKRAGLKGPQNEQSQP